MKDYNDFSYGKLDLNLAVVPETDTSSREVVYDPAKSKVNSLLAIKQEAVDVLDSVFHSYGRTLSENPYHVIRNALEDMAEYIRKQEDKPKYNSNYNQNFRNSRNDYKQNWNGNNQKRKKNQDKNKRSAKKRRNYFDDESEDFF